MFSYFSFREKKISDEKEVSNFDFFEVLFWVMAKEKK